MIYKQLISLVIACSAISCGGGGNPTDTTSVTPVVQPPVPTIFTGLFLDSAVAGLTFKTSTEEGSTHDTGEFTYQLNEKITFSIGAIKFPQVTAAAYLTPLDIFDTQNINDTAVVNMLRLLQSLDIDGDASNGIRIPVAAHELASSLSVEFSATDFDDKVADLIAMSGAVNQQLISAEMAVYHFQQTLTDLNNQNVSNCEQTHNKVGYTGYFSTLAHNVSGKATIIDNCTIRITEFSYDGGGPEVYMYAALDHQYASDSAFSVSQKLNGSVYNNDEFTLRLPDGKSLDNMNGLSVWCVDFNANFGELEFTP